MCVKTVGTHESGTIKAVMDIGAGLLTVATSDVCSIATLPNGKYIQQTVVKETSWQRFEAISFWQVDFCLTLGASKLSMSLAHSCTAKGVKTRYNFRLFVGLETNWASNLFGEISQKGLHCQRSTRLLVNTAWKSYCLKFREKQDVVEWPYELKLNIFRNWAIITQLRFCCRRSWPIRFLFVLFVCMFSRITDF